MSLLVFVSVRDVDSASLTDPASRAEEAKTAIADALAWTELESKAQEARDTIMARTRANYGWTIDESSLRHFSVTTSVEAAREALTNVEPPPWPGESRADEPLQALRDELIAVSGNPEKWNKDLQNSLLAFEKSATAPYNRLLNALHGITLALSSENGEESFIHGVEELEEIAKSTKDREESTWNPMLKKLACIIPDVKTLSARTFTTSPSERDLHPSAVANSD